jgi:hypothetical protein
MVIFLGVKFYLRHQRYKILKVIHNNNATYKG